MTGEIQHDTVIAAAFTSSIKNTTGSIKNRGGNIGSPSSVGINGISDAFTENGAFPGTTADYVVQLNGFADKVSAVSSNFEALDQEEAAKFAP